MKKATIYDFARMCKVNVRECENCPMWNYNCIVSPMDSADVDKANKIILKWCEEHPIKTRQDELLKMFPNAKVRSDGVLDFPPCIIDKSKHIEADCLCSTAHGFNDCDECRKEYWLAEVDE